MVLARLRAEEEGNTMKGVGRRGSMPQLQVAQDRKPAQNNNARGTLAYMSPEQTGRMNRVVDYRSDFYSLGITFFELLAGRPPFFASEPLEYIHLHLAKAPPRLEDTAYSNQTTRGGSAPTFLDGRLRPTDSRTRLDEKRLGGTKIPTAVGDIIAKLLAKTAEERYQSALGLCADLKKCLHAMSFDELG